jgi:hypothetical protein
MPRSSARCWSLFAAQAPVYLQRLREARLHKGPGGKRPTPSRARPPPSAPGGSPALPRSAEKADVEADAALREAHRDEARRRRGHGHRGACRFIARLYRPPEAHISQGLNLRDRPANTPRGRNKPCRDGPNPARRSPHRAASRKPAVPMAKITLYPAGRQRAGRRWRPPA